MKCSLCYLIRLPDVPVADVPGAGALGEPLFRGALVLQQVLASCSAKSQLPEGMEGLPSCITYN